LIVRRLFGFAILVSATLLARSSGAQGARRISFLNDVEPILTRAGCNQGSCHGSQFGKGGFKLSLAGYDPDFDHIQIVRQAGGRRVNRTMPAASLVLRKPALMVAHQGGLRLAQGTADYRAMLRWLADGSPGPNPRDPVVTSIRAVPDHLRLVPGQAAQLKIVAGYSDGSKRDVTAHTRISSLNDAVAPATPEGLVTAKRRGATAVMLRYSGLATVTLVSVPFANNPVSFKGWKAEGFVDRAVENRWRDMGLAPSGVCSDTEFLRRASLDIIGTLPTADEVRAFLSDRSPDKRARLINRLLDRPEYADYQALKWSDLLRNNRTVLGARSMWALNGWIRQAMASNMPFDRFARELLTARGLASESGPANYYRVATTPQDLTETTAQLFLGVRLQCAKCHHHPFEKWSQQDYYQFAAYFARVGVRPAADGANEPAVRLLPAGEVTHPKTGAAMQPTPLAIDNGPKLASLGPAADRREALAEWLTSRDNLLFAKVVVNRYWGALMGRGIVDPVDDMRVTNPPSNPELLDGLARDFIAHGYDIRRLVRTICTSQVYQLSAHATASNRQDEVFFSHFRSRRLSAEVMLDAVSAATGVPERFADLPPGTRAIQLPDSSVASPFLDTFGRPPRATACECERVSEPTLAQALQLLSGDDVSRKVASPLGRITALMKTGKRDSDIVEELYLATLSRFPNAREKQIALRPFSQLPRRQAAEDLLWALLNTQEFSYVR
jgi:hypothetical protein